MKCISSCMHNLYSKDISIRNFIELRREALYQKLQENGF